LLKEYLKRMRGRGERQGMHNSSWILWSGLGSFLGLWAVSWINSAVNLAATDQVLLIGSFGASAVLIYGVPHVPFSQPRNLIGGHLLSALAGVTISQYLDLPQDVLAALAVAIAIMLMHVSKTIHPPGGATALIAVIGSEPIQSMGFLYVLQPVFTGVLAMLVVALLINNLSDNKNRHYPKSWY
jgi:CBS domain-containing membrane protein